MTSSRTDAGRALLVQGARLEEARNFMSPGRYLRALHEIRINPREATQLAYIGKRLMPLLERHPRILFPHRLRTLKLLAELSVDSIDRAAVNGMIGPSMTESHVKALLPRARYPVPPVIRPTDNWNFTQLRWPRIDGFEGHGYIPGDLYANCLWYYAQEDDLVLDPMAGSGMILRVWAERTTWAADRLGNVKITGTDLKPRGPYIHHIGHWDLLNRVPSPPFDYVILDPPYPELVIGQYSDSKSDLANMKPTEWIDAMRVIAKGFFEQQPMGGRITVIISNNRSIGSGRRMLYPEIIRRLFGDVGYWLFDTTYSSRRIQKTQGRQMAILNNQARRSRVPMSDVAEVLTFVKPDPAM